MLRKQAKASKRQHSARLPSVFCHHTKHLPVPKRGWTVRMAYSTQHVLRALRNPRRAAMTGTAVRSFLLHGRENGRESRAWNKKSRKPCREGCVPSIAIHRLSKESMHAIFSFRHAARRTSAPRSIAHVRLEPCRRSLLPHALLCPTGQNRAKLRALKTTSMEASERASERSQPAGCFLFQRGSPTSF